MSLNKLKRIGFLGLFSLLSFSTCHSFDTIEKGLSGLFHYTGIGSLVQNILIPMNCERYQGVPENDIKIPTLDNVNLDAIWTDAANESGPTMILCHGNGMIARDMHAEAEWFKKKGVNSLAFTIRGYPGSGGSSSSLKVAAALDIEAVFRYLMTEKKIEQKNIAVYGFSLGGGYATYAARHFNCPVILQNAFTRPGDVAYNLSSYSLMGGFFLSGFFVSMPPSLESIPFLLPFSYLFFYPPKMITNAIERSYFDYQEEMPNLNVFDLSGNEAIPVNSFNNVENLEHTTSAVMIIYGQHDTLMGKKQRAMELYEARYKKGYKKNDADDVVDCDDDAVVCIDQGSHICSFLWQNSAQEKVEEFLKKIFPVLNTALNNV